MYELPKIRIEVENMKYQIIHAFAAHNDEIEKAVNEELTKAVQNYPFSEKISQVVNSVIADVITETIKDYFVYGEGRKEISDGIQQLMSGMAKRVLEGTQKE